jgi:O-methyltransferase
MADQRMTNTTPNRERSYPAGYGVIEPVSNYRPWDVSTPFQSAYAAAAENTMVDQYRLWVLWTLVSQVRGERGALLEVGSWRGGSGAVMAAAVAGSSHPARRVVIADTFEGVVKAGPNDSYYRGGEHANASPQDVRSVFASLSLSAPEILVGIFPEETAEALTGEEFALVHIDVDVYAGARDVFAWAWPRMVPGGVVVFDDYGFYGCEGVTAFVEELIAGDLVTVIPNLTGQAVVVHP